MGIFDIIGLGYDSYKNAQEWSEYGVKCVKEKEKVFKKRQKETEKKVRELDNMKLGIWQSFSEFVDLFESISNKPAHLEGSYTKENIDISKEDLQGLKLNASVAGEILIGTAEGAAKGAALGGMAAGTAVVAGAVKTMGLTWVGIEGGFTVATQLAQTSALLKTTLFTPFSAFVIPTAIVTAVSLYNSTIKSIDKAYDIYFQSLSICRKYGEAMDRLFKIEIFCDEFQREIEQTNGMFQFRIGRLKEIVEVRECDYRQFSDEEKYVLESTILLLKYLKAIISEPIFRTKDKVTTEEGSAESYFNEYGVRKVLETAREQRGDLINQETTVFSEESENRYDLPEGYVYKVTKNGKRKVVDTEKDGNCIEKGVVFSCKNMHIKLSECLEIEGRAYFEDCFIEATTEQMYALQVSEGYCVFKNCEFVISKQPKWCIIHSYGGVIRFEKCKFSNLEIGQAIFRQEGTDDEHQCFIASLSDYRLKSYVYMDHCVVENSKGRFLCVEDFAIVEMKECKVKNHVGTFISSDGCESADSTGIRMTKCRFDGCTPWNEESYLISCTNSQITADNCDFKNSKEGFVWDSASETIFSGCSFSALKPDNKIFKEKYAVSFGYKASVMNCNFIDFDNANVFIGSQDGLNSDASCKIENCMFEKVKGEIFVQKGHILRCSFADCVGYVNTWGSIARDITMVNCYDKDRKKDAYISRGTNLSCTYKESAEKKKARMNLEESVSALEKVADAEASEIITKICKQVDGEKCVDLVKKVLNLYYPQKRLELDYLRPIINSYLRKVKDDDVHSKIFAWDNDVAIVENGDIPILIVEDSETLKWIFTDNKVMLIKKDEKKEWLLKEIKSFFIETVTTGEAMGFVFRKQQLHVKTLNNEMELIDDSVSWIMERHINGVNEVIKALKDKKKRKEGLEKAIIQQETERAQAEQREKEKGLLQDIIKDSKTASIAELEDMIKKIQECSVQVEDKTSYIKELEGEKQKKEKLEKLRKEREKKEKQKQEKLRQTELMKAEVEKEAVELAAFIDSKASGKIKKSCCIEVKSRESILSNLSQQKGTEIDTLVCKLGIVCEIYTQKFVNSKTVLLWKDIAYFECKKKVMKTSLLYWDKNGISGEIYTMLPPDELISIADLLNSILSFVKHEQKPSDKDIKDADKKSVSTTHKLSEGRVISNPTVSAHKEVAPKISSGEAKFGSNKKTIELQVNVMIEEYLSKVSGNNLPGLSYKGTSLYQGSIQKINSFIKYVEKDEFPLMVYDSTILLSCKKGFLVTNKRLYNLMERTQVKISDIVRVSAANPSYLSFELVNKQYYSIRCDIANDKKRIMFASLLGGIFKTINDENSKPSTEKENDILANNRKDEVNFCGQCGAHVNRGDLFCGKCGKKL